MRKGIKGIMVFLVLALAAGLLLSSACAAKPTATTAADFFKNNIVTCVVNGGAGGGTAFVGRLVASFWTEVTGGPMMVKIVTGGGGINGLDFVYKAKPDGLTVGTTHHPSDLAAPQLLKLPGAPAWDPRELIYLGFLGFDPQMVFIKADSPIKTVDDLKKAGKIKLGASNPGSMTGNGIIAAIEILGLSADVTFGYEASEMFLGVQRNEILGFSLEASTGKVSVDRGFIRPFLTLAMKRTPWFPDTPAIAEVVQLTPAQQDIVQFIEALVGGKSFYAPPKTPADKVTFLRRAFDTIGSNADFVNAAKVRYPIWVKPLTGEELEKSVAATLGMPPAKVDAIRQILGKYVK